MPSAPPETRLIEPAMLERLGQIVVHWSFLETLVADLFTATVGGEAGSMYVVTENVSISTVTDWTRTMIKSRQTPPDIEEEALGLLNEVDGLRAERNALVHGLWVTDASPAGSVVVHTVRWERREVVKTEVITVADLDELVDAILDVTKRFLSFLRSIDSLRHQ